MIFGLAFCLLSIVLTIVFFSLAASISKTKRISKLDKENRGNFYAKVTAMTLIGLSIAACSTISVLILIKDLQMK